MVVIAAARGRKKLSPVQQSRIAQMKLDGFSLAKIAQRFKVPRSSVQRILSSVETKGMTPAMRRQKIKRALSNTCHKLAATKKCKRTPRWIIGPTEILEYMGAHQVGLDLAGVAMP